MSAWQNINAEQFRAITPDIHVHQRGKEFLQIC